MGSPVDLTLGCSTPEPRSSGPNSSEYKNGSAHAGVNLEALRKAKEHLCALEDERRKIEGFKRELPLCIRLLEDAIEDSKERVVKTKDVAVHPLQARRSYMVERESNVSSPSSGPVLEEFMPLRRWNPLERDEGSDRERGRSTERRQRGIDVERPPWMAEAQLWTQGSEPLEAHHESEADKACREIEFLSEQEQNSGRSSQHHLSSKQRPTGAFLPFIREQPTSSAPLLSRSTTGTASGADVSLSSGERVNGHMTFGGADSEVGSGDASLRTPDGHTSKEMGMGSNGTSANGSSGGGSQSQRKARRCWSPELHRRFVSALHQLGGSQVATPKQIRELMKVDGLTNDEVKSHLQKYRLHTRRPSPSPQSAALQPPQLVVLGGIWVPPQYAAATQTPTGVFDPSIGHQSQKPQYCQPSLPQDYFARVNNGSNPVEIHRQPLFEPQQAASQSQSSPQGPLQITSQLSGATQGPSSDAYHDDSGGEEEGKSDSTSRGGQRCTEDEEEPNGGESTENHNFAEHNKRPNLKLQMSCAGRSQSNAMERESQGIA